MAAEMLLRRRSIRRSLTEWCRHCGFTPAPHHALLVKQLERVASGENDRLAVFMPPGSAKSTYGSILFQPHYMAGAPGRSLIAASHTTELAEKWGRKVRNLVTQHGPTLGVALSADSQSAGRWSLANGGEYYAAGVGTGIAGFRADGAVIDDPIRSREDADSELIRERIWDWYKSDLRTRLKPGGFVILIQTRWHEDDLAGRVLDEMAKGGEQWEVLSLPAIAEGNDPLGRAPGEWLWDDDYGYGQELRRHKRDQTPRNWSALFQQRPAPEEGNYFREEWLRPSDVPPDPATLSVYGGSDYAVTADGGDYTVHVVVGVDSQDRMYLLDLWRKQASSDIWVEAWCDLVKQWRPQFWGEELVQITSGVGPFLEQRARERKAYCAREQFPTRGDKGIRAQSIRGRMAMLGLYVPMSAPWYADMRAELLSFPAGKHDDIVDALGLVGQLLDRVQPRRPVKADDPTLDDGYTDRQDESMLLNDSFLTL